MMTPAVLSAALLLLLLLLQEDCCCSSCSAGAPAAKKTPFTVVVSNSVTHCPNKTYDTYVFHRGILQGGLRRLHDSGKGFNFTYTEDYNYGPFLQSVNGLAGHPETKTYWQLLVKKPDNETIELDVGIGCYIPCANDQVILNYNTYQTPQKIISHPEL